MPHVSATWTSPTGSQSVATGSGGHSVVMDAPNGRAEWAGFKPSELLLAALLGCTGVDFTSTGQAAPGRHVNLSRGAG
jgi:uncharacterized OsmC-like protein